MWVSIMPNSFGDPVVVLQKNLQQPAAVKDRCSISTLHSSSASVEIGFARFPH
ncbi:predicted protein [Botrytis cinerea T4]|uniref:Uncharacterized protein n=1 Tax=Botryotinia fuckeliana (strain T4) TaxID=999810 RepID=G2Y3W6_BOTF4|nr:predicted protein [Botrytis cinerea T4]